MYIIFKIRFSLSILIDALQKVLIRERVKAGLDSARQNGRRGGRPKALTTEKAETVRALRQTGKMSVKQICETIGISCSVFYRCINELEPKI